MVEGVRRDWVEQARLLNPFIRNFVGGAWRAQSDATPLEKYGSRDGRLLYRLNSGTLIDAHDAVASARRAFEDGRWSQAPAQRRKDALHRLANLIDTHAEELALLECLDVGKPITDALEVDVPMAAAIVRFNAEALDKLHGRVYGADSTSLSYQLYRPLGVVGGIVGWNFPLVLAATKIAPALAAGNSLVLKPSELTSLSASRLAELAMEAGVPAGVLNVIHGDGALGAVLARHQDVDALTFTGSTQTGKKLMVAAGESNLKPLILECGGKAANIVFDDSPNLEAVADAVIARAFWNQGQVCTASSRLLLHERIKNEFLALLITKMAALVPGDPLKSETRFGALASEGHLKKVLGYLETARQEGAEIAYQSTAPAPFASGFYLGPTVLDAVSSSHRLAQEEIFGPVLSVLTFRDESEAIRIANDTLYGLSAILWTKDLGRAHRLTQAIKAGWIVVNATGHPAGGPVEGVIAIGGHKQSGLGVEGGLEGLDAYMSKTAVQLFVSSS